MVSTRNRHDGIPTSHNINVLINGLIDLQHNIDSPLINQANQSYQEYINRVRAFLHRYHTHRQSIRLHNLTSSCKGCRLIIFAKINIRRRILQANLHGDIILASLLTRVFNQLNRRIN